MRKILITAILGALCAGPVAADPLADNTAEAREIVKQFFGDLKGKLQEAMKKGGPTNAIGVCRNEAPGIAKSISGQTGWSVGRTSLKLRNFQNRADDWERQALEEFDQRKAAGEDITKMEKVEVVSVNGQETFRYMKAIPTAALCLNCHGAELKPEVKAKLDELYPTDQATGYQEGDIRGAFTLSKTL
jgi:hypothetical protein